MKDLTRTYSDLLQDKRVRSEQNKYEAFSRQRNSVLSKYRKVYAGYKDLVEGLARAQGFYSEMAATAGSLKANVDAFVSNRRSEGGQLLNSIEAAKNGAGTGQADRERERLQDLMERMSISNDGATSQSPALPQQQQQRHRPPPLQQESYSYSQMQPPSAPLYNPAASPPKMPRYQPVSTPQYQQQQQQHSSPSPYQSQHNPPAPAAPYNPNSYGPVSPPAQAQYFSPPPGQYAYPPTQTAPLHQHLQQQAQQGMQGQYGQQVPAGYVPPPPPPGPPPAATTGGGDPWGWPGGLEVVMLTN